MSAPEDHVPEGYTPLVPGGEYFAASGPVYQRPGPGGTVIVALRIARKHTNMRGVAHGGLLVTVADSALGRNIHVLRQQPMASVSLSSDFLSAAKVGDWLEAHVTIRKHGSRLSFAECNLMVGERAVLRCSGVFAVVNAADSTKAKAEVPEN